jgi:hypothetical protein
MTVPPPVVGRREEEGAFVQPAVTALRARNHLGRERSNGKQ